MYYYIKYINNNQATFFLEIRVIMLIFYAFPLRIEEISERTYG